MERWKRTQVPMTAATTDVAGEPSTVDATIQTRRLIMVAMVRIAVVNRRTGLTGERSCAPDRD
jgi:hypothetical protein